MTTRARGSHGSAGAPVDATGGKHPVAVTADAGSAGTTTGDAHLRPTSLEEVGRLLDEDRAPAELIASLHGLLTEIEHPPPDLNAGTRLERLRAHHSLTDQLRAHRIRQRAHFALTRVLALPDGEDLLGMLFDPVPAVAGDHRAVSGDNATPTGHAAGTPSGAHGVHGTHGTDVTACGEDAAAQVDTAADEDAPALPRGHIPHLPGQRDPSLHGFLAQLLPRADLHCLAASLDSTLPAERRATARAVLVRLGLPALLERITQGVLPYNRLEKLLPRLQYLSLAHLHMLDAFLADLDPRLSLGRFLAAAHVFLTALDHEPLTPAQARRRRRVILERRADGTGTLTMEGPLLVLEALYQRLTGTARALLRNQLEAVVLGEGRDHEAADTPTPSDPNNPATSRALEDRTLDQLVFDLLAGALPQTSTTVEEVPAAGGQAARHRRLRVSCPTDGTWLRRQAAVNVTVPVTTLLRSDDRPATLAGRTPLPAEFAREIAAHSTVWNRLLTDPATGIVLDEKARTYVPDQATRIVVNTKWQTCTAPGCTRPAKQCEFEHGVPFNHDDPDDGGLTHPANGHPMCRRCHGLKTAGIIGMERTGPDEIHWTLPLGVSATTLAAPLDSGGSLGNGGSHTEPAHKGGTRPVDRVTTPQASARIAAEIFARLEAEEKQAAQFREAARAAAVELRKRTDGNAEDREDRLGAALREATAERRAARLRVAQATREQESVRAALEELREKTIRLDDHLAAVRSRERRVARIERGWWQRTRQAHLRLRSAAAQQSSQEESALLSHEEQFSRLLTRPGVCPHTDLEAELAHMRAEDAAAAEGTVAAAAESAHTATADAHAHQSGGPDARTACPDCEAEYAAFLREADALTLDDIDDYLAEEALALAAEEERERARSEASRRAEAEAAEHAARLSELTAAQRSAEERSYIREGHRLGRERARAEHADTLAELCPTDCCAAARASARTSGTSPVTVASPTSGTDAEAADANTAVAAQEWVSRHCPSYASTTGTRDGTDLGFDTEPPPF